MLDKYKGLVWIKNNRFVRNSLTAVGEDYTGTKTLACYKEQADMIGVPPQWARNNGYVVSPPKSDDGTWKGPKEDFVFRPQQEEAFHIILASLMLHKGGISELPTGFGKTVIGLSVAARLNVPTLVLCHKTDLLEQWEKSAFDFFGEQAGRIQQDTLDYKGRNITTATVQTMFSRRKALDCWSTFGFVICDEAHRFPANTFIEVMSRLPAKYRLGLSATFRRSDKLDSAWKWFLGDKSLAIVTGHLAGKYQQVLFTVPFTDRNMTRFDKIQHARYVTAISKLDGYNDVIATEVDKLVSVGRKVLVVSDRIHQLSALKSKIKSNSGYYVGAVNGKQVKQDELDASKEADVILATPGKIGEGTDIPELDTLVLVTPKSDVEQIVGRITRKKSGKKEPFILDFVASTAYNISLGKKRQKIYKKLSIERVK